MKLLLLTFALIFCSILFSQEAPVITIEEYLETVAKHHPLSRVADIQIESADANLQNARGSFDPKIEGDFMKKDFDQKEYYEILEGGIKIPTWMGATFESGISKNQGLFLNPEDTTPNQGLVHAGLKISLGKGLLMDERRAMLKKAQFAQSQALEERKILLNDLLFEAGTAYWEWFNKYHAADVYDEARNLAQQRLDAVRMSAQLGDKPYIDTLEASIQSQVRTIQWQQASLEKKNAAAQMSIYLWLEGKLPMVIDPNSKPPSTENVIALTPDQDFLSDIDNKLNDHPLMVAKNLEIDQAEIDLRWKREQLKPQIDLKYNALTESLGGLESTGFNSNDFTFGLEFSMPILWRKERGAITKAGLKIEEKQLGLATKRQDIWLKAQTAFNHWELTAQQLNLIQSIVRDYEQLLLGERELFLQGESSLFLVNSRESSYVGAKVKMIELKVKNRVAELKAKYAMAELNLEI